MPIQATIQFVQGVTTFPAGQAAFGAAGTAVKVQNATDTPDVKSVLFELVGVSSLSALVPAVKQDTPLKTWTFTPDAAGGYLVHMLVRDALGNFSEDYKCFGVKEGSGRFVPPFGADKSALNFGGQATGWDVYVEAYLRAVDAGGGHVAVASGTTTLTSAIYRADCDASTGGCIVFFEASPAADQAHLVVDDHAGGSALTNSITVNGNGKLIEDPDWGTPGHATQFVSSYTFTRNGQACMWTYTSAGHWKLVA